MARLPLLVPVALVCLPGVALAGPLINAERADAPTEVNVMPAPPPPDPPPPPSYDPGTYDDGSPCDPPTYDDDAYVSEPPIEDTYSYGYAAPVGPIPDSLRGSRWEAEVGVEGAPEHGMSAGDLAGSSVALAVALGHQFGPIRLTGEYSIGKVSASRDLYTTDQTPWGPESWWAGTQDVAGESSRIGASARVRAVVGYPGGNADVYGEGGVGRETIHWDGGATLRRNDVALGGGLEIAGGQQHIGGLDLGVRVLIAPAVRESAVPACSGACTLSEDSAGTHDFAVLMHAGILFGG